MHPPADKQTHPAINIGLVWLLSLPAVLPLLTTSLPRTADGLLHLYRVIALDDALWQGVIFPRWLPDLAFGYGLPLFVFYAPISYYLTEAIYLLGVGPTLAINLSFALAILLGAAGMYLFMRDTFGALAGVVASVAYSYAPYLLATTYLRGSLPSVWATALFPFAFWAMARLLRSTSLRDLLLAASLTALAMLAHNISNVLLMPLLLLFILCYGVEQRNLKAVSLAAAATALALAMTAFFWLPAVIEREFVQIERVITPPDFDYRGNFLTLASLVTLLPPANTGLLNPAFPTTLGIGQSVLSALGLISLALVRRLPSAFPRSIVAFALIGLLGTIFMTLPISVTVWDQLPLIAFLQQPMRLLTAAAFLMAILSGAAIATLPEAMPRLAATVAALLLLFLTAVPMLYPRYWPALPAPPTLAGMMQYEQQIGAIGTTSFGEYLPTWVTQRPLDSPMLPSYDAEQPVDLMVRFDESHLPVGATVEAVDLDFAALTVRLDTPQPFLAVVDSFYFPGWQASLDGVPIEITPTTERGLIGVAVPAGAHTLTLAFTETPIRRGANWLSLAAVLLVLALSYRAYHTEPATITEPQTLRLTYSYVAILAGVMALLLVYKVAFFDRVETPLRQDFAQTGETGATVSRMANFGHQLTLLGYDLETWRVTAGNSLTWTLYWQARQSLITDYSVLAHLVDGEQHIYAADDTLHPGGLPTTRWPVAAFVRDPHTLAIPHGLPPGDYFLITGPYDPTTWGRLLVVEGGDEGWVDVIAVPVEITAPSEPPSLTDLAIAQPVTAEMGPLRLLGLTAERDDLVPNDFLRFALFWEAMERPTQNYQVQAQLLDAAGSPVLELSEAPSHGRYPTSEWQAGERVRDNHAFRIPETLPAGAYQLRVRLLDEAGDAIGAWTPLRTFRLVK